MSDIKVGIAYPAFYGPFKHYIPQLEMVKDMSKVRDFDLMIFSGGEDICPYEYGQSPNGSVGTNPKRDEWEKKVYSRCMEYDVKVFGVCRGHQFFAVMNRQPLVQDISSTYGYSHPNEHTLEYQERHPIQEFFPSMVNSLHHQAVNRLPNSIRTVAMYRGQIEIMRGNNLLSVQFHPEFMDTTGSFFTWLVNSWAGKKPVYGDAIELPKRARKKDEVTLIDVRKAILSNKEGSDFFAE